MEDLEEELRGIREEQAVAVNQTRDAIKATNQYQHLATTAEEQALLAAGSGGRAAGRNLKTPENPAARLGEQPSGEEARRVHNEWDDEVAADIREEAGEGAVEPEVEGQAKPLRELSKDAKVVEQRAKERVDAPAPRQQNVRPATKTETKK